MKTCQQVLAVGKQVTRKAKQHYIHEVLVSSKPKKTILKSKH